MKGTMIDKFEDGWYLMNDNWIQKEDDTLIDCELNEYKVLEFKEEEKEMPIGTGDFPSFISRKVSFSCIKLNKPVNIGTLLYIKVNDFDEKYIIGADSYIDKENQQSVVIAKLHKDGELEIIKSKPISDQLNLF